MLTPLNSVKAIVLVPPRLTAVPFIVILLLLKLLFAILVIVLSVPLIVLFVRVCVAVVPTTGIYVVPSVVYAHKSVVSFQINATLALLPRKTSSPAFSVGVPVVKLLFRVSKLSAILTVSVLTVVVVPLTVKFPLTVTLLKVTLLVVLTS